MSIIPATMGARQVADMADDDFDRLVVEPGRRMVAEMLEACREMSRSNQLFLDERYPGMTMEDARRTWTSDEIRDAKRAEYAKWSAARETSSATRHEDAAAQG